MSHIKAGSFENQAKPLSEIEHDRCDRPVPSTVCATSRVLRSPPRLMDVWGAGWVEWKGGVEMRSLRDVMGRLPSRKWHWNRVASAFLSTSRCRHSHICIFFTSFFVLICLLVHHSPA